ncbi:MAG: cyclic nucleotide-binding domain-containing protein [Planctomycetes bacterium]|nr:cyclic nucleotide-binding domain-containing protein [Planctomycetota bacterium]
MAINTTDVNLILDRLENITRKSRETTSMRAIVNAGSRTAFLRSNDLIGGAPKSELERFVSLGVVEDYAPGAVLFAAGDDCGSIQAVVTGIVEIQREHEGSSGAVALIGPGDLIGLLGAITGGKHRSAGILREGGQVLTIPGTAFMKALEAMPVIAARLVRDLAGRLMGAVKRADMAPAAQRQLEGSLAHFDLAVVLQSVIGNEEAAGTLTLLDDRDDAVADILVACGRVAACRFGQLTGLSAFRQLFLGDLAQYRFFYVESDEAREMAEECPLGLGGMTGMGLLMDCARIVDENRRLEAGPLGRPETRLRSTGVALDWSDDDSLAMFQGLMVALRQERCLGEVLEMVGGSRFEARSILDELIANGAVEIVG